MTTDIAELLAEVDTHLEKHKVEGVGEHHSIMRRLAAELRQRIERDGWRPIKSAPRDGTRVLLFYQHRVLRRTLPLIENEVPWEEDRTQVTSGEFKNDAWWYVMGGGWIDEHYSMHCVQPTHWKPLPPPPETKQ